jgi:anaphase-promoting complex subunit 6
MRYCFTLSITFIYIYGFANRLQALAISPQDPIATELLEKALKENANTDALFQATLLADGEIVVQGEEDVDFMLHERMLRSKLKSKAVAASGGHRYGGDGGESSTRSSRRGGTASGERRRLGDVTSNYQEVGGESMDLSDEEL